MSNERNLRLALHQLVEAIEYTPMGVRGIKAMANARKALAEAQQPATGEPDEWKLVPIVPTEKMLLAYTGGAVTNAGFRWCRHQWSAMLAAAPAAHPAPSVTALIEEAISSGHFGVLPMKATTLMCKAGWGASGGELTFQQIGHIYEEMYKARPLPDDAMLAASDA